MISLSNNKEKPQFFATTASITALVSIYNQKSNENVKYGIEVCEKYLNNDAIAIEAINEWIDNICICLHNIILFINPEVICLGGGISEEDWFIELVEKKFTNMNKAFMDICTTKIERCLYSNDFNILGAVLYSKELDKFNN